MKIWVYKVPIDFRIIVKGLKENFMSNLESVEQFYDKSKAMRDPNFVLDCNLVSK